MYSTKLNENFSLIYEKDLDKNPFEINGKEDKVRCIFQVWTKLKTKYNNLRILKPPIIKHEDFKIYQYNNTPQAKKYLDKESYQWQFAFPRQG